MKEIVVSLTQTGRHKLSCDEFQIFCLKKLIFMSHKRLLEKNNYYTNYSISFVCSVIQLKTQSEIVNHVRGDKSLL